MWWILLTKCYSCRQGRSQERGRDERPSVQTEMTRFLTFSLSECFCLSFLYHVKLNCVVCDYNISSQIFSWAIWKQGEAPVRSRAFQTTNYSKRAENYILPAAQGVWAYPKRWRGAYTFTSWFGAQVFSYFRDRQPWSGDALFHCDMKIFYVIKVINGPLLKWTMFMIII